MKIILFSAALLLLSPWGRTQNFIGKIIDSETGTGIPMAKIEISELNIATTANENGIFVIQQNWTEGLLCKFGASGYREVYLELKCCDTLRIKLSKDVHEINEVRVNGDRRELGDNKTQRINVVDMNRLGVLNTLSISESLTQIEGIQTASYGPLNTKPVVRGLQGMRVVTLWDGMRIENQQWGGDHGLGISQVGISSAEVIKGPLSLLYQGDAVGGLIYLKEASYAPNNQLHTELNSQFESASLGSLNSMVLKWSKNRVHFNVASVYSNHADYRLPNGKFLNDSRLQDFGGKINMGYNFNRLHLRLNYLYSNSTVGIPGHTHDTLITPESFMTEDQNRNRSLPHQWIKNHFLNLKAIYFLNKKHKLNVLVNAGYNNLSEYEDKIFTPAINMLLSSKRFQLRHKWKLDHASEILSGIQMGTQQNSNGANASETILANSLQEDFGAFTSYSRSLGKLTFHSVIRVDHRNLMVESSSLKYTNLNGGVGLRKVWQKTSNQRHDLSLNVSSGSRAPHTSELFSNGIHHGASRFELGDSSLLSEVFTQLDLDYYYSSEHFSFLLNPYLTKTTNFIQLAARDTVIDGMPVYAYEDVENGWMYGLEARLHYHPHFLHMMHFETGLSAAYGQSLDRSWFYFFPQNRWQTTLRFDLSEYKCLGFKSLVIKHQYFFEQNRIGSLETASASYHYFQIGGVFEWNTKNPISLTLGVRNVFNTTYVNHLSRLKPLGLAEPGRSLYLSIHWQNTQKLNQ